MRLVAVERTDDPRPLGIVDVPDDWMSDAVDTPLDVVEHIDPA